MMSLFYSCSISFLGAFLTSGALTSLVISVANRYSFIDKPDGKLKKHTQSVPYGGGFAIFATWLLMVSLWCGLTWMYASDYAYFIAGASILFALGFCDDLYAYRSGTKFLVQMFAALLFLMGGFYLKEDFLLGNIWRIPGSFFWILTITNSFNLIDIMDGLASTVAAGITVSFLATACALGQLDLCVFLSIFLGSITGFLYHNAPSATIYMGDAGSLFVGGTVAILPFCFTWGVYQPELGYIAPAVIMLIPIAEVCALVYIRWNKGISPFTGSPDHFAHYLLRSGYTKYGVLGTVVLHQIFLSTVALAFTMNIISLSCLMVLIVGWIFTWVGMVYAQHGHMGLLQECLMYLQKKSPLS